MFTLLLPLCFSVEVFYPIICRITWYTIYWHSLNLSDTFCNWIFIVWYRICDSASDWMIWPRDAVVPAIEQVHWIRLIHKTGHWQNWKRNWKLSEYRFHHQWTETTRCNCISRIQTPETVRRITSIQTSTPIPSQTVRQFQTYLQVPTIS